MHLVYYLQVMSDYSNWLIEYCTCWAIPKVSDVTLEGQKVYFYIKGKDELMKVEVMK